MSQQSGINGSTGENGAAEQVLREKLLQVSGPLLEPVYWQTEPSKEIRLGKVRARYPNANHDRPDEAEVIMRFAPNARLCFVFNLAAGNLVEALSDLADTRKVDGDFVLEDRGVSFHACCLQNCPSSEGGTRIFVPRQPVIQVSAASNAIVKVTFHIFNFPNFIATSDYAIASGGGLAVGGLRLGRLILTANGWRITIVATPRTKGACNALHALGGFIITHVGEIERCDRAPFSTEQADDVLRCVHTFLSLATGRWVGVGLPVGVAEEGTVVFEQWGLPRTSPGSWKGSLSWFDEHHGAVLADVFPAFVDRWKCQLWGPAIRQAIGWYLAANERGVGLGVDGGLILAQTALEYLTWTYCIRDKGMLSSQAFGRRGLSAADRVRLFATALGIPSELPSSLRALHTKRGNKWAECADAITNIRNAVVHPSIEAGFPNSAYYEAWALSLWYLDLVFLRLLSHTGEYANRLKSRHTGQVERVPWA